MLWGFPPKGWSSTVSWTIWELQCELADYASATKEQTHFDNHAAVNCRCYLTATIRQEGQYFLPLFCKPMQISLIPTRQKKTTSSCCWREDWYTKNKIITGTTNNLTAVGNAFRQFFSDVYTSHNRRLRVTKDCSFGGDNIRAVLKCER